MILALILLTCSFSAEVSRFSSAGMNLALEEILSGQGIIWGMDFLPDGRMVFSERSGALKIFHPRTKKVALVRGTPNVAEVGQGGMLDVRFHRGWLYFSYSVKTKGGYTTRLARAKLRGRKLANLQVLLTAKASSGNTRHFGSRIAFDGKGHLFLTVGDRAERHQAQNTRNHKGAILRLKEDGSIPADNPFGAIWSYGHRNPQGLYYDSTTGNLWSGEHGPRGGDEINLIKKGGNYGWPKASHGSEYFLPKKVGKPRVPGTIPPVKHYTPSIAPCGLTMYTGNALPGWKNNIFMGSLKFAHLNRVVLDKRGRFLKEERLLNEPGERIRNVRQGPDGLLYLSTDGGHIWRIRPALKKGSEPAAPKRVVR